VRNGANYRDGIADVKSAVRHHARERRQIWHRSRKVAGWGESAGGISPPMGGVTSGIKAFDVGNNLEQKQRRSARRRQIRHLDMSKLAADFDEQAKEADNANDNPSLNTSEWRRDPCTGCSYRPAPPQTR